MSDRDVARIAVAIEPYRKQLAAVGGFILLLVAALFGAFEVGRGVSEGALENERSEVSRLERVSEALKAQRDALEQELQRAEADFVSRSETAGQVTPSSCTATGFGPFIPFGKNQPLSLCIVVGKTKPMPGGKAFISVVAITTARESSRSRVTATIDAPGQNTKPVNLEAVDVGFSVAYRGFEIRVTQVDPISATFMIARV